ncbi:hypothetical protein NXY56_005858 [Leishmania guyanensis]
MLPVANGVTRVESLPGAISDALTRSCYRAIVSTAFLSSTHTYQLSNTPSSSTEATRAPVLRLPAPAFVAEADTQLQSLPDTSPLPQLHPNDMGCAVAAVAGGSSSAGQLEYAEAEEWRHCAMHAGGLSEERA